jgi:hypothetical protein
MPVPGLQALAEQLAFYEAEHSLGAYAPRHWFCRSWYGSNGSILLVGPKRLDPPYFPLPTVTGPAVLVESFDSESSGRVHIALVAARLFPVVGHEFISRIRQEHLIADSAFETHAFPEDQLQYLSDRLVQFTTPGNHEGLGTQSMLESSSLPIRGLAILSLEDETKALTEVRVRMPAVQNAVAEGILRLEAACVQLSRGCPGYK